ncbi:tryptophan synthase subunit alpha [Halorussus gelatinilyticus]|uniref:Tryptophan synthase alpha chain n=1 Tax=Halorussus gelatinilyticus TaxID=2937524 RepID=A0A8U0IEI2_9EURY|nr:tryptophan synthase subunit alpha [Halorussus gelatinilyticus]UPV99154.1 tryptophan synthase subunit alpha [Halorussus gelatinilyticus]
MSSEIEAAFADEPALVSYVAAGDPDAESTKEYVRALVRGGTDVVELGLPFSEPVAEGPTIQQAIRRALDAGMTPDRYFDLVAELREEVDVPLVCMTYYNLIYQYGSGEGGADDGREGPEPFVAAAAEAGISGLIVPDLPVDESDPLKEACETHGLDLIFIVAPTTTDERLGRMLSRASGFVYVQGRLGTTGARSDVSDDTHGSLDRLAETDLPKAVGFGISEGDHAREIVAGGADGIIVGSAFVDIVAEQEDTADRLEAKARELKAGALDGAPDLPEPESK